MEGLANVHLCEVLLDEFLNPINISTYKLSKDIGIPQTRTSAIVKGERAITALRLASYFGNSAKFWFWLQADYDLEEALKNKHSEIEKLNEMNTMLLESNRKQFIK